MKRLVRGSFLFLFLFLCSMQTAAAASIRIFLDDKAVSFAEAPFIENDRVLVPMRGILESLGYSVAWQEESKTVLAEKDEIQISLHPDEKTAIVNGKAVSIDAPAKIRNGRTFVPLRFLAEYSGAEVTWNQSTSSVSIPRNIRHRKRQKTMIPLFISRRIKCRAVALCFPQMV